MTQTTQERNARVVKDSEERGHVKIAQKKKETQKIWMFPSSLGEAISEKTKRGREKSKTKHKGEQGVHNV
jgi:hypothetical protein